MKDKCEENELNITSVPVEYPLDGPEDEDAFNDPDFISKETCDHALNMLIDMGIV